jgi:hypothetical protein
MPALLFWILGFWMWQQGAAPAPEPLLRVNVNGTPVRLYPFHGGYFGQFELAKPAEVVVQAGFDVRWVDVRPMSFGVIPQISPDHSSVRLRVPRPMPLTLEFNGDWRRNVIHLFAQPPEKNAPKPDTPNVKYFGPGEHEPGLIELKDGETLYLAQGAFVKGIVRSVGTKNVTIRGRGILDASRLARRGEPGAPPDPAVAKLYGKQRNMIYLENTENAAVEGITLLNSQSWTLHVRGGRGTHIDGINMITDTPCSTDGIDLVSVSDALVENIFVRANDDCVVVKNTVPGSNEVRNIRVRRAVLWNMPCGNGIEVGFELRAAKIHELHFEDIDIIRVERGAAISIHNGDTAVVENVSFNNIRVEGATHKLIDFAVVYGQYGPDRPERPEDRRRLMDVGGAWDGVLRVPPEEMAERAKNRGHIRNVKVTNLHVVDGGLPFSLISGFDEGHAVENVVIEGMRYLGRPIRDAKEGKFSVAHAPGFRIR